MADGGAGTPGTGSEPSRPRTGSTGPSRLGNPTRLVPKRPQAEPAEGVPTPELVEADEVYSSGDPFPQAPQTPGFGGFGSMFGPRSIGGGRVQVWGCSPGCLIVSIVGSLLLTLILNGLL